MAQGNVVYSICQQANNGKVVELERCHTMQEAKRFYQTLSVGRAGIRVFQMGARVREVYFPLAPRTIVPCDKDRLGEAR